tara:strand:+ start:445 stop:735 length:291 start_codon:yes stop_codon:yes gene_type:complete
MAKHHNISGALTQEVLAAGTRLKTKSIWIANTHASDAVTVDLYVEKSLSGKYYYMKSKSIAVASFLQLENIFIDTEEFGLYVKLNNSDSQVSIIML